MVETLELQASERSKMVDNHAWRGNASLELQDASVSAPVEGIASEQRGQRDERYAYKDDVGTISEVKRLIDCCATDGVKCHVEIHNF